MAPCLLASIKRLFTRASRPSTTEACETKNLPLPCPEGFLPVSVPISGVSYYERAKAVLRCSLREEVTLQREPENTSDKNAIQVVNKRGEELGYIGRRWASWLAPSLDRGEVLGVARITELVSDLSGATVGVKIGLHIPASLQTQNKPAIVFNYETTDSGITYLFLDCDVATLDQVREKLIENKFEYLRSGLSYCPAADGRQYEWYAVLAGTVPSTELDAFFKRCFNVEATGRQDDRALDDLADTIDLENQTLRQENAVLLRENRSLKGEVGTLQEREEEDQRELERLATRRGDLKAEILKVIKAFLVDVQFLRDSADVITKELRDYQPVLQILQSVAMNHDDPLLNIKPVHATEGWMESHYNTGERNNGRVYFKRLKGSGSCLVLVSFKVSQDQDIRYLKTL